MGLWKLYWRSLWELRAAIESVRSLDGLSETQAEWSKRNAARHAALKAAQRAIATPEETERIAKNVALLKKGVEAWNAWRRKNQDICPVLSGADLSGADLSGADLSRAHLFEGCLIGANFSRANLSRAFLARADLFNANLSGANLSGA